MVANVFVVTVAAFCLVAAVMLVVAVRCGGGGVLR